MGTNQSLSTENNRELWLPEFSYKKLISFEILDIYQKYLLKNHKYFIQRTSIP